MLLRTPFVTAAAVLLIGIRAGAEEHRLPSIASNDNRVHAGTFEDGTLVVRLRASRGLLRPEGESGPAIAVEAFGEDTGPLRVPAPLLRVPEGTTIAATVRNDLPEPLRLHGFCAHDGGACAPVDIAAGASQSLRFVASRAGTYHYWGTTTGMPLPFRATGDTQLSGAFVVDAPGTAAAPDRVLVITDWTNLTREQLHGLITQDDPGAAFLRLDPRLSFFLNGRGWPATERFVYPLGSEIRWRVVNLSTQAHPMHLHGFYFTVDALGDGLRDETFDDSRRARVVTQVLQPGATMAMTWRAERAGNWLFHCHVSDHISPKRRLTQVDAHADHGSHDMSAGMAGMVLGVTITPPPDEGSTPPVAPLRHITLAMRQQPGGGDGAPNLGFATVEGATTGAVTVPGPTLVLRRGEPVEITLRNELAEATSIHWHGIELDSYFDGVHGWSGAGTRVSPMVAPGESFSVRITPPHTGTFIYHTHLHDDRQLTSGMYGALVVLDPGETFDPSADHVVVIGRAGIGADLPTVLNGEREPTLVWKAGMRHRVRIVNITPSDILTLSLATPAGPVTWRPVTKDGAPVPSANAAARAATQTIAVGETYDFEIDVPAGRRTMWLEVRTPGGKWRAQGRVIAK